MAYSSTEDFEERRMVVAVDESEESLYALRWALCNMLSSSTARFTVILLYARPPPLPVYSMYGSGYMLSDEVITTMDRYSKDLARSVLARAENMCRNYNNIKVEAKETSGDARDVICNMVEKLGADILVMGSHGYGFIKRALMGSVSDYCARNVKCPVVIVKRTE